MKVTEQEPKRCGLDWLIPYASVQEVVNKLVEFCITLLLVFILIELSTLPDGCDFNQECLYKYIKNGGASNLENDFVMTPCSQLREACWTSEAGNIAMLNNSGVELSPEGKEVADKYKAVVAYCKCLLRIEPGESVRNDVYCNFDFEQQTYFWTGLVVIAFMEISSRKSSGIRRFRVLFQLASLAYFLSVVFTFDANSVQNKCGSYEFSQNVKTLEQIALACFATLLIAHVFEFAVGFNIFVHNMYQMCCKRDSADDDDDEEMQTNAQMRQPQRFKTRTIRARSEVHPANVGDDVPEDAEVLNGGDLGDSNV